MSIKNSSNVEQKTYVTPKHKPILKNCEWCKKDFLVKYHDRITARYCSKEHAKIGRHINGGQTHPWKI